MNNHRLYGKSKKIQGRGFFSDLIKIVKQPIVDESKTLVRDKLNEIFSKKKGAGLKIFYPK